MPMTCTVCQHSHRGEIDRALVAQEPLRNIAQRFQLNASALHRHKKNHLMSLLAKAHMEEVARADDLLGQLKGLLAKSLELLAKAEGRSDYRTALAAVREARGCLELMGELTKQLDRRPQINLLLSAEWQEIRILLLEALEPYPEARAAVAARLSDLEDYQ